MDSHKLLISRNFNANTRVLPCLLDKVSTDAKVVSSPLRKSVFMCSATNAQGVVLIGCLCLSPVTVITFKKKKCTFKQYLAV